MAARARRQSVRATDLDRLGKWAAARGLTPVAIDALPGGAYRLHFVAPVAVNDAGEDAAGKAAWDADLA